MRKERKKILIPVVILRTKRGFSGFSPIVPGCVATGKTLDGTLQRLTAALEYHIDGMGVHRKFGTRSVIQKLRSSVSDYGANAVYAAVKIAA